MCGPEVHLDMKMLVAHACLATLCPCTFLFFENVCEERNAQWKSAAEQTFECFNAPRTVLYEWANEYWSQTWFLMFSLHAIIFALSEWHFTSCLSWALATNVILDFVIQ